MGYLDTKTTDIYIYTYYSITFVRCLGATIMVLNFLHIIKYYRNTVKKCTPEQSYVLKLI